MARLLETDTFTNKNIATAVSIGSYTATATRLVHVRVAVDQVAGNGDYIIYATLQIAGSGSAYVIIPKTTAAAASGETALMFVSGPIPMDNADVLQVYIDGLAGDTTTPDTRVDFYEKDYLRPAVAGRTLAVDASGNASANVTAVKGAALTESAAGRLAAALSKLLDVASPVLTAESVNQGGDAYARLGAPAGVSVSADVAAVKAQTAAIEADTQDLQTQIGTDGAGLTAIGDTRIANLDATVSSRLAAASYTAPLDAAGVRTAVGLATANLDTQLAGLPTDADVQAAAAAALTAYDPPTDTEMDAGLALLATSAALAVVDANVDAVKIITDQLDVTAVTQVAASSAGHLSIVSARTFNEPVTGLTIPATWVTALWTLKTSANADDADALVRLRATNPADVETDGLERINGAAPASPMTLADGSLTVDQAAGSVAIWLSDELTALLAETTGLGWDVKFIDETDDSTGTRGTADVTLTETHATA